MECVEIVGSADDLVLLSPGDTVGEVESKAESAVETIQRWLEENKLQMASQKTELVVVTNRRQSVTAHLELGSDTITSKRSIKYLELGVMIDDRLNFTSHVDYACERTAKVQTSLARLMPNKYGAKNDKRRLLANVTTSILRSGGETWIKALESKGNRDKLNSVYRLAAMRFVSAYRTVSYDTCCIADMMPICRLIQEDAQCIASKRRSG